MPIVCQHDEAPPRPAFASRRFTSSFRTFSMKFERLRFSAFAQTVSFVFIAFSILKVTVVSFTGQDGKSERWDPQVRRKDHLTTANYVVYSKVMSHQKL